MFGGDFLRKHPWLAPGALAVAVVVVFLTIGFTVAFVLTAVLTALTARAATKLVAERRTANQDVLSEHRGRVAAAWFVVSGVLPAVALARWSDSLWSQIPGVGDGMATKVALGLALVVAVGAALVAVLGWRVLSAPEEPPLPDVAAAGVRAISEIGEPDEIARRTLPLLWERSSWIIRRVEHIRFIDRTMVRRHVSVDFRVPNSLLEFSFTVDQLDDEELELVAAGHPLDGVDPNASARYVPVSVLRGWPPVLNLDLRDSEGNPLPLLSKTTTNALDGRLLIALARHAFRDYADDFSDELLHLVHGDGPLAQRALIVVTAAVDAVLDQEPGIEEERVDRFLDLARLLVHNTLLWVPVTEPDGTRLIIKLAYDEPVRRRLSLAVGLLTGFGLRSHIIGFEVGQVGDAGSYHLEIDLPFPLEATGGALVIASRTERVTRWQRLIRRAMAPFSRAWQAVQTFARRLDAIVARRMKRNPPHLPSVNNSNFPQLFTRRLHFYTSGQKSRPAMAWVRVAPERRGVPLAGAVTGLLVAAVATGFNEISHEVYAQRATGGIVGATIAFLLLAPGLVSYVLTRPTDHPFVTRMLSGIRVLTVSSVLVAVGCAATLLAALATKDEAPLDDLAPWLMRASWALACALLLGLFLPLRRRRHRKD